MAMESPSHRPKAGGNGTGRGKAVSPPANGNRRNGYEPSSKANGSGGTNSGDDLDQRILGMEKAVGSAYYRNILREYGRVNQPKADPGYSNQT